MKNFLVGILTFIITVAVIVLGFSINLENTIIDTVDVIIKKEATNYIANYLEDKTNVKGEEIKKGINKVMEDNKEIKKTIDGYFNEFMNIMNSNEEPNINIAGELENIINKNEEVLKEYGVNLTKEEKDQLLNYVASDEITSSLNKALADFKSNMPSEVKTSFDMFNFFRSNTFKTILIVGIIILLIFIALLKKSYFKWLINFGVSTIISGLIFGLLIPTLVDLVTKRLASSNEILIATSPLTNYGYITLSLGIIAIIIHIILCKVTKKEKVLDN